MARWFVDRLPQRGIPSVSLRRLLPEARFVGCMDWEVSGCSDDHRRLDPGQVFVAVREARPGYDGHVFVREALERARPAWWWSAPAPRRAGFRSSFPTPWPRTRGSARPWPATRRTSLSTLGVTGSFGKTITALMVRSILEAAGAAVRAARLAGFLRRDHNPRAGSRLRYRLWRDRCRHHRLEGAHGSPRA